MLSSLILEKIAPHYEEQYGLNTKEIFLGLIEHEKKVALKNVFPDSNLSQNYFLDEASLFVSNSLPLKEGMRVLDMCSAPGGKLLGLIYRQIPGIYYVANDLSKDRVNRLRKVLNSYLPKNILENYLKITNKDAIKFGLKESESFDAILLDAPCSNEGHLVKEEKYIKNFKGLSKSLPKRQYALLCSALLALKPEGHILYSTCSINQNENDGVIERLQKKKGNLFFKKELSLGLGDKTKWGMQIFPHRHKAGPLYLSLLQKV